MIPPADSWTNFLSDNETLSYMKAHGLASASTTWVKSLVYAGFYTDDVVRCLLVGYISPSVAVIEVSGELHCINIDHLRDMQRGLSASVMPIQYVVFDIETTGLSRTEDSIIEIAAIRFENGIETETYSTLVKPDSVLPLSIQDLTGITPDMLEDAPPIEHVLPAFLEFAGSNPLVGHNVASFDILFLKHYATRLGLKINNDIIDTLPLARKAYPELGSHKLSILKDALSINVSASHRALPDVLVTAELFKLCMDRILATTSARSATVTSVSTATPGVAIDTRLSGMTFVITGALNSLTREVAGARIEALGGRVSGSVSTKTNYVVAGDAAGTKLYKARELGIPVLNEDAFTEMIS